MPTTFLNGDTVEDIYKFSSPYELLDQLTSYGKDRYASLSANHIWLSYLKAYFKTEHAALIRRIESDPNNSKFGDECKRAFIKSANNFCKELKRTLARISDSGHSTERMSEFIGREEHISDHYFMNTMLGLSHKSNPTESANTAEITRKLNLLSRSGLMFISAANNKTLGVLLGAYSYETNPWGFMDVRDKDSDGKTIYQHAVHCPPALQRLWNLNPSHPAHLSNYPLPSPPITAIRVLDKNLTPLLHLAASNYESLLTILLFYSGYINELVEDLEKLDKQDRSIFQHAASNHDSLECVMRFYAESLPQLEAKIRRLDKDGCSLLESATSNFESFELVMEHHTVDELLAATQRRDKAGRTLLHHAVKDVRTFKSVLALYPTASDRRQAIQQQDNKGLTVLHHAVNNLKVLEAILECYPEEAEKLKLLQTRNLLFHAASNVHSLHNVLSLFPNRATRLEAVRVRDIHGNTLLHLVADDPELLNIILEIYSDPAAKLEAVEAIGAEEMTVLHHARNSESIQTILDLYSTDTDKKRAVEMRNMGQSTVLHYAASHVQWLPLHTLLAIYPDNAAKRAALSLINHSGTTVLETFLNQKTKFIAAKIKYLRHIYPSTEELCDAFDWKKIHDFSRIAESIKAILELLPETKRLTMVEQVYTSHFYKGNNVLHSATKNVESFATILALLPEKDRLAAISKKDSTGKSIVNDYARTNPELQSVIVSQLPLKDIVTIRLPVGSDTLKLLRDILNKQKTELEQRKGEYYYSGIFKRFGAVSKTKELAVINQLLAHPALLTDDDLAIINQGVLKHVFTVFSKHGTVKTLLDQLSNRESGVSRNGMALGGN